MFEDIGSAQDFVENNRTDITDGGVYNYAVIERYTSGAYPHPTMAQWYEHRDGKFYPSRTPKELNKSSGFAFTGNRMTRM